MRQKQSSKIAIILSIIIELLLAFGAILGNFASDALKVFVRPYLPYSFFIFVTMTLVGIGLTFWKHRLEAKSESSIPIVNNDGEATHSHAGVQGGRGIIGSLGSPDQRSRLGALQLALAVIVLPLVAILTFINTIVQHLWLTVFLLVFYEVIIFIAIIAGKVWEKLERSSIEQISNWVDLQLRGKLFGYQKRYYQYLFYQNRDFDVKGLSTQGTHTLELEHVFVELSIDPKPAHQTSSDPLQIPDRLRTGRHSIWDYLASKPLNNQHLVIIGAPGSGKTTLLKHMTLTLISRRRRYLPVQISTKLPILLFLRDHIDVLNEKPDFSLIDAIQGHFKRWNQIVPPDWLDQQLVRGRCLILLDGLDEIAAPDIRRRMVDWVQRQMVAYGQNRFIVTSRPFGYRSNPLSGVTVLEVRSFTSDQIEQFIKNWYIANEIKSRGQDNSGVRTAATIGSQDLLRRLRNTPALLALAVNPLLLTMIATIHLYRGSLPDQRVALYAEICEVFLGKRQEARGLVLELTAAQKQQVLQPLAYQMMQKGIQEISLAEACQLIANPLTLVSSHIDPKSFLLLVENASGLLLEREHEVYSFAHLTFQEYLAAVYIKEQGLEHQLMTQVGIGWWHETIRLYCAQTDASSLISACLTDEYPSVPALTLAIECQQEALKVNPSVKAKLDNLLDQGVEDTDPERRRVVTEAILARRLRQMVNIGEFTYADTSLISCAEYQLFLDEHHLQNVYYQPDHWVSTHFSSSQGRVPILGVRPSDATAFCRWLTERESGDWQYRLPTTDELEKVGKEYSVNDKFTENIGSWVDDGKRFAWIKMNQAPLNSTALESFTLKHPRVLDLAFDLDFALKLALELDRTLENSLDSAHYLESNTTIIHDHNSSSNYKSASNDDNQLGVASPKSYEQSTSLYFNSNTNNDNARARALNNARERALSRTRARATSSTRARALINARLRAFDVAQNLEPSITNCAHTPIPNYDDESNNDNDRALIRVRARQSIRILEKVQAGIHDAYYGLALARACTSSPFRAHSYARPPDEALGHISNYINTYVRTFQALGFLDLDSTSSSWSTSNFDNALADVLNGALERASKRLVNITHIAGSPSDQREGATFLRWYICFFAQVLAIHLLYQSWKQLPALTWLERSLQINKAKQQRVDPLENAAISYLNTFASFALLEERIQGKFPACEGILIVKERNKEKN